MLQMKGYPAKRRLSGWNLARRLAVATCVAVLVAGVWSRVNQTATLSPEQSRRETLLEEVIPDVSLDMRTLRSAIMSLANATSAKLVIDPELLTALEGEDAATGPPITERFRNVRLGILLARLFDAWEDRFPLACRVDKTTILFCRQEAARLRERRLYDLRPFERDWDQWDARAKGWYPPSAAPSPSPVPRVGRLSRARRFMFTKESKQDMICARLVGDFIGAKPGELNATAVWAGWAVIEAPMCVHHRIEQFLAFWRSDGAAAESVREIPIYRHGDLAEFTAQVNSSTRAAADSERMSRILPVVKCAEMPLEKFASWIAQSTGTNVVVDWYYLAGTSAVGANTPVTLDLKNVTAASALQAALDNVRQTGPRLGFVCVDGVLKVSIRSRLERRSIQIYEVRDLIEHVVTQSRLVNNAKGAANSLAKSDALAISDPGDAAIAESNAGDALRRILTKTIEESWPDTSHITYFAGRIIVNTTATNHQAIASALATLRIEAK
jgi:hypothetical protein